MEERNNNIDKNKLFVPVKPDRNLKTETNSRGSKAVTVTLITIAIGIIIFFVSSNYFMLVFNTSFVVTILIYIIAFSLIAVIAVSAFVYNGTKRITERSALGGNKSILRSTVWHLSNNLKQETLDLDIPKKALIIRYGSSIGAVVGITNGCLEAYPDEMKYMYHHRRQQFLDSLLKRGFKYTSVEKKYNVNNDKIWRYYRNLLHNACVRFEDKGYDTSKYSSFMNESIENLYYTSMMESKVTVNYILFFKANASIKMLTTLINNFEIECSSINPVDLPEFNTLQMDYYGDESMQITNEIPLTLKEQSPGLIEYIGYIDENGKFVQVNDKPKIKYSSEFSVPLTPKKSVRPVKKTSDINNTSIFFRD